MYISWHHRRDCWKNVPSLAEDLLVPIDEVHGGKTVTSIRYSAWCAIIPLVYWELDLHPIHAVPRENTILPSYTQSERIKLRLSLQDHGDPIVIINRSDNQIKCVLSPLRRKSVAYGECQWGKPFREVSSFARHNRPSYRRPRKVEKTICVEQVLVLRRYEKYLLS